MTPHRPALLAAALLLGALVTPGGLVSSGAAPDPCRPWTVKVLASGLGSLENLEPDGRDGLLYSVSTRNAVERFTRDGRTTKVADVTAPGGLRVRGASLLATSGNGAADGALGRPTGSIVEIDLRTGRKSTWASGLTMPNGLLLLPDGSALTSRDVTGLNATGITRVARKGATPQSMWSDQADSNGLALDPSGRFVYTDETFTAASNIYRIRLANPKDRTLVASLAPQPLGVPKGLDDLTLTRSGALYVTANGAGEVLRLDPRTRRSCVVVTGLMNPSAVKQGRGRAFPDSRLYVVGFDGRLLELIPPAGLTP